MTLRTGRQAATSALPIAAPVCRVAKENVLISCNSYSLYEGLTPKPADMLSLFGRQGLVCAIVVVSALGTQGCLPDPDRELARYQRDAIVYAAATAEAYGEQWEAGLVGLWEGVRAAVVYVASEDADGILHDLAPALEQEWSRRWPGLVPMRTSMSPNDTLLVLQPPVATGPDQAQISARLFFGGHV